MYEGATSAITLRTPARSSDLLAGLDIIDPGVAAATQWRPDADTRAEGDAHSIYVAVGHKT